MHSTGSQDIKRSSSFRQPLESDARPKTKTDSYLHPHYVSEDRRSSDSGRFLTPCEEGRKHRANSLVVFRQGEFDDLVDHLKVTPTCQSEYAGSADEEIGSTQKERSASLRRSLTPPASGSMRRRYNDQYYYQPDSDRRFSEFAPPADYMRTDDAPFARGVGVRRPQMSARVHSQVSPYEYFDEEPLGDMPYRDRGDYDQDERELSRRPRRRLPPVPTVQPQDINRCISPGRQLPVPEIQIQPETPHSPPHRSVKTFEPNEQKTAQTTYSQASLVSNRAASSWREKRLTACVPDFSDAIRQESIDSMDRGSTPECITPPPRTLTPHLSTPGYQPAKHTLTGAANSACRRRPSLQSNRNYVETQCTCPTVEVAESSSAENLGSKSSDNSDADTGSITPRESWQQADTDSGLSESIPDFKSPDGGEGSVASSVSSTAQQKDTIFAQSAPEIDPFLDSGIGMGILKFSVQYFPLRKRVRIQTRKAEDLATGLLPGKHFNSFIRVYLMPGKIQKQISRTIRNNRSPAFNEEFFFDNISSEEVGEKTLIIEACYDDTKSQRAKEDEFGKISVALGTLNGLMTKKEIHCTRSFKPKDDFKKLGKLQIYTCLEKDAKRFTVNVIKADDLPKFPLIGTPDPFVKIVVDQNGRIQSKQTRTLKNTTSPTWKEAVMFLVEVTPAALQATKITVGVHDAHRSKACSDVIGVAILGKGAREKSETDQWKHLLSGTGKDIKATHHLRSEQDSQPHN